MVPDVVPTWADLVRAVELQYGPSQFDNLRAQLFKLEQTSSVVQYHTAFTTLAKANRVEGLSDAALLDCFVSGLHVDIRRDVLAREPDSLLRAVALAKLYDVTGPKMTVGTRPRSAFSTTGSFKQPSSASSPFVPSQPPLLPTPATKPSPHTILRPLKSNNAVRKVYAIIVMNSFRPPTVVRTVSSCY